MHFSAEGSLWTAQFSSDWEAHELLSLSTLRSPSRGVGRGADGGSIFQVCLEDGAAVLADVMQKDWFFHLTGLLGTPEDGTYHPTAGPTWR